MLNEVVNINVSKVYRENGEVKTILSEEIQKSGYMDIEEARQMLHAAINKQEELLNNEN